jgi:UDP-N-acetylglucosamine:LPS N-acetylglucosamine transferase
VLATAASPDRVWVVLPDPLSTRIFFDCRIVDGLVDRLGERLQLVSLMPPADAATWVERIPGVPVAYRDELMPWRVGPVEKVRRRIDLWLDRKIGFYPLAIRLNLRHGFHLERMHRGHQNFSLDLGRIGPLPRSRPVDEWMLRWHYGTRRYVSTALLDCMRRECAAIVFSNLQTQPAVPFLLAARRLGVPSVGYVASWDHTVGKGVISPHVDRYVVQNDVMRDDLERYHAIPPERVVVTGWPQTDVYFNRRPREDYDALLRSYSLDPRRPLVMVMGNTPTNAPYERQFVERVMRWWDGSGSRELFSLLFRPHPRDRDWEQRFTAAIAEEGVHVQSPSYTDLDVLATLLQHAGCVVSNAGTIVLDALVNDRPTVCVLYDEGAPGGESWAAKNVLGEHYRQLMESSAFYLAHDFAEVTRGVERALADPAELAEERRRVSADVVGVVDGRAAERVVDAIVETVGGVR